MHREEYKPSRLLRATQPACRFDAIEARHGDVEHDDIGMEPFRLSKEFVSIADFADNQTLDGQGFGRPRKHGLMIVSQQHARALRGGCIRDRGAHGPNYRRF